jgi:hypothetical protein
MIQYHILKINLDLINFLSHVMTFWRSTLNLSINNTKLKSEPVQIKRGIYQGDPLSPLWFCLAIIFLTNLLNSTGYGFNIRLIIIPHYSNQITLYKWMT